MMACEDGFQVRKIIKLFLHFIVVLYRSRLKMINFDLFEM